MAAEQYTRKSALQTASASADSVNVLKRRPKGGNDLSQVSVHVLRMDAAPWPGKSVLKSKNRDAGRNRLLNRLHGAIAKKFKPAPTLPIAYSR